MGNTQSAEAPRKKTPNKLSKPRTNTTPASAQKSPAGNVQRRTSQLTAPKTPNNTASSVEVSDVVTDSAGTPRGKGETRQRIRDHIFRSKSTQPTKRRNTIAEAPRIETTQLQDDSNPVGRYSRPNSVIIETPVDSPVVRRSRPSSLVYELPGDSSFFYDDSPQFERWGNTSSDFHSSLIIYHQTCKPQTSIYFLYIIWPPREPTFSCD
jgi:hypothetical protein